MPEIVTRPTAFATCAFCSYVARLSGDTALEVDATVRAILRSHLIDSHPDHCGHPLDGLVVMINPAGAR